MEVRENLMAAQPTPQPDSQPQGGTPSPGGVSPAQQQANPLQQTLAKLAQACEQLSQQNPIVQGELMEARTAFVKALQKTMMAARPQQEPQTGPQGQ
jgi:hypothetical protein